MNYFSLLPREITVVILEYQENVQNISLTCMSFHSIILEIVRDNYIWNDIRKPSLYPNLTSLAVYDESITTEELEDMAPRLRKLQLVRNKRADMVLPTMTNLTHLSGKLVNFKESTISSLTKLEELNMEGYRSHSDDSIFDFSCVDKLTNLKSLYVNSDEHNNLCFPNLVNLTSLCFGDCYPDDYSWLAGLTNLTELDISSDFSINEEYVSYDVNLSSLANLRILDISMCPLQNIEWLSLLTNLTVLNTNQNGVEDKHISGLVNLEHLSVHCDPITDKSLSHLTKLECLSVNMCQVTERSISILTNLIRLDVCYSDFKTEVLSCLTNLEYLECFGVSACANNLNGLVELRYLELAEEIKIENISCLTNLTSLNLKKLPLPEEFFSTLPNLNRIIVGDSAGSKNSLVILREIFLNVSI